MTLVSSRNLRGRCHVCAADHAACGTAPESVPVDDRMEVAAVGGPLKRYQVTMPSGTVTTMKLNKQDAERLGVLATPAPEPEAGPQDPERPVEAQVKRRSPRNKARTVEDKDGAGGGDD